MATVVRDLARRDAEALARERDASAQRLARAATPDAEPAAALASGDALALAGVSRVFGALRAIDDVTFAVAAGERRAILG
ncbi:MAG: hypothetical protein ABWZ78_11695, partial [Burkholderiaceae bacterium]